MPAATCGQHPTPRNDNEDKKWEGVSVKEACDNLSAQNQRFSSIMCVDEALRFPPRFDRLPTVRCFLYAFYGNPLEAYYAHI
jgi:hypothetical protein